LSGGTGYTGTVYRRCGPCRLYWHSRQSGQVAAVEVGTGVLLPSQQPLHAGIVQRLFKTTNDLRLTHKCSPSITTTHDPMIAMKCAKKKTLTMFCFDPYIGTGTEYIYSHQQGRNRGSKVEETIMANVGARAYMGSGGFAPMDPGTKPLVRGSGAKPG
jgi:hypothetical protein